MANFAIDVTWDDNPVDVAAEANFIWSIANKLRGAYMPDQMESRGVSGFCNGFGTGLYVYEAGRSINVLPVL